MRSKHAPEQRNRPRTAEQRTVDVDVRDLETRGNTVHGYACVYGAESEDLGGYRERFAAGAFADVVKASDVRALLNHDRNIVLGRQKAGTLRLEDDETGLRFEIDLPDTEQGREVRSAVERGDIDGASFDFTAALDSWAGDLRTVEQVSELRDISIATEPAYPSTSVELRTRPREPERTPLLTLRDRDRATDDAPSEQRVMSELTRALREVPAGETRTLSTAISITPTAVGTALFDRLRARAVMLRSGIRVIDMAADSITYPTITADANPAWTAEGAVITPGDPTFSTVTATPRKLAHIVQLNNEVIDDSSPDVLDVLNAHLLNVLALKLDFGLLEGSGTAPEVRGLKNVAGIQSLAAATNGQQPTFDNFSDAIALLEGINVDPESIRVVMHTRNVSTLRKLKASTAGSYLWGEPSQASARPVWGKNWLATTQLSTNEVQGTSGAVCNSAYIFSAPEVIFIRRQDPQLVLDRSRLFNSDQSEIRATQRLDLIVPNPIAVVRLTGLLP